MNEEERNEGLKVFRTVCKMLDDNQWKYDKDEEKLVIRCTARGDDLPISLLLRVEPERKIVLFTSHIFEVDEAKRSEMAVAVVVANYELTIGCFDFDIRDGELSYRVCIPYRDSILGSMVFGDLLYTTCATVDKYNDKFFMLGKGMMKLDEFINFVYGKN